MSLTRSRAKIHLPPHRAVVSAYDDAQDMEQEGLAMNHKEELNVSLGRWLRVNARGRMTMMVLGLVLLVALGVPADVAAAVLGLIR